MAARAGALLAGAGIAAVASFVVAALLRRARHGEKSLQLRMRQLPSELTEPAAPGTPEPGRLLNEGPGVGGAPAPTADAANKHRPSDAALQAALRGNQALFQGEELRLLQLLVDEGQAHLFAHWPAPGLADVDKRRFVAQALNVGRSYPGGLQAYLSNARRLLTASREGLNAWEGFVPSVPNGERLDYGSDRYLQLEEAGLAQAGRSAFVLVAGGLGERLGYKGIKVALPSESATERCFLQLYVEYILALQDSSGATAEGRQLPLAIMTSDDTHASTAALLEAHAHFGAAAGQITLIKQEKVPCLIDNEAHLALDPSDQYLLQTKPHGHGDVHSLLHSSGLAAAWHQSGLKWVCFFQDTNALVFRGLLPALGVSSSGSYDMISVAVPRRAKEAIGAIATLTKQNGADSGNTTVMTVNVEYNQLDPLLRGTISPSGDVDDETGFSPFPGNINQLVLSLPTYVRQLAASGGAIGEFVNPKYADASRTSFKSSTRLECMMQDYPQALPQGARVGFAVVNQVWATYSPVKNSPADARVKAAEGAPTHSATTGEMDIYKANCAALNVATGGGLGPPEEGMYNGVPVEEWPRVVLSPSFAPSLAVLKAKVAPGALHLTPRAALVIDGRDIEVRNLRLDGALIVRAVPGAHVLIDGLSVSNAGWEWASLDRAAAAGGAPPTPEEAMRGFRVLRHDTLTLQFDAPGEYHVPPPSPTGGKET